MEHQQIQLLYNLRSIFFDHMELENGNIQYDQFVRTMLAEIKRFLEVKEVTLFKCDDWKQHLFIEASTDSDLIEPDYDSKTLYLNLERAAGRNYYYNDYPFREFKNYQLILPLKEEQKVTGLVAVKEKVPGSLSSIGAETGELLTKECTKLLETALNIYKVVMEEKRHKQLFKVTEKFHSSMSMDAVLGEIIDTLQEVYPSFVYYLMLSHDNNNHENLPIKDLEYDSENVAAMQAYVTGTIQFENSLTEKKSVLYAPLRGKQGIYGVLQVIAPNSLVFPENEVEFITLLANTAGSALENAQLYQQSKRLISDLQLINETSHRLNSNLRLSETITYMKEQIIKSFDAQETGFIFLLPSGDAKPLTGSSAFFQTKESEQYIRYSKERMDIDQESLFIGDVHLQSVDVKMRYRSLMAVPMLQSNSLRGFAVVLHKEPYYFSFEMFKLLQSLIHHSSLALANSMLREELEKLVITDHLTRLYSRNYLDEKIYQSMEEDEEGAFILIDIDDFKKVNDTYGHQVGDEILIQVAKLMHGNIRETDIGARWGGEELAIYLPRVPLQVGVNIAQRLLEKVSELSKPKVTISCGVSYWKRDSIDNAKALFKRADEALYLAKNSGKNKVLVQNR
ncbi:diguanylate cyclase [Peribacillus cavernae]|uniref:Diguanylate cyclase n=1 Tax=Peribacillus cavernae TaxID=1674310 RepID=A0A3S0TZ84_9BACI|nr:diguanylate cyclase [Peribacillus cavernae]MDQ0221093.1 diguanylate cyclase (GGDEF)-like protein [Peribacillus cavernae]RUQ27614.1 diguanylate cyclase [Peribacillus cavernae]